MAEQVESKPSFSPYTTFPAEDRTKIEIIDSYLDSIRKWQRCLEDPLSSSRLKTAVISLLGWYVWVHGYTQKNNKKEMADLRSRINRLDYSQPELGVSIERGKNTFNLKELTEFMLFSSEYMFELKITDILHKVGKSEDFIAQGMARR